MNFEKYQELHIEEADDRQHQPRENIKGISSRQWARVDLHPDGHPADHLEGGW
jgi:hypothetical protein